MTLHTTRLALVLQSTDEVRAEIARLSDEDRAHVSPAWLAQMEASVPGAWTHGFTVRLRETDDEIGSAGFKGPPDADGVVELAYGIAPEHRGRGFATEAAAALVEFAVQSGLVRVVRAHTLPETNASTRILTK